MSEGKAKVCASDQKLYAENDEDERQMWWKQLWLEVEKLDNRCVELKAGNKKQKITHLKECRIHADEIERQQKELTKYKQLCKELGEALEGLLDVEFLQAVGEGDDSSQSLVYCREDDARKALSKYKAVEEGGGE